MKLTRPVFVASFTLAAVIFMLYSVSLGHNFLFDEENIILYNPHIKDFAHIPELFRHGLFNLPAYFEPWQQYYRPLTALTFAIDYHFWKGNPLGYNITNTILHGMVSILFFRLLLKIYRDPRTAFLCAFLYAVHPIHTEAVTYIASRSDPLSGIFTLSVLLYYWNSRLKWAFFAYGLSLFVKESMVLIPAYLILLEGCFLRSGFKRSCVKLAPFFVMTIAFVLYRKFICPIPLGPSSVDWRLSALRFLSMGPALLSYFQALIAPERFKFSQWVHFADRFSDPIVVQTVLTFILLTALWFVLLRYKAGGFFGISFFLVSFLPSTQVIPYYPQWADHYLYIPFMGLMILAGDFLNRIFKRKALLIVFLFIYVPFTFFLCVRTWQRNEVYDSAKKFYEALSASDTPYTAFGYQNLARLSIEENHWDEALPPLKVALALSPFADVTNDLLGRYYTHKKNYGEALKYYERACSLNPGNYEYQIHLGNAFLRLRDYDKASKIFEEIQKKYPKYREAYLNLIIAHELAGRPAEAFFWGRKGLEMLEEKKLDSAVLSIELARMAFRQNRDEEAQRTLEALLEKHPDVGWYADVARFLTGRISETEFLELLKTKYQGFESTAENYLLMYYVMNHRCEKINLMLRRHRNEISQFEEFEPVIREIKRAEEASKGCQ